MLKAYFLKEDPLWFAFWGLLTAAERGVLCEVPAPMRKHGGKP